MPTTTLTIYDSLGQVELEERGVDLLESWRGVRVPRHLVRVRVRVRVRAVVLKVGVGSVCHATYTIVSRHSHSKWGGVGWAWGPCAMPPG